MMNVQAVQFFVAVSFLVIGLSHLFQPKAWLTFYQKLAAMGALGAFAEGFLCLNFGAFIVSFHNIWQGPGIVVTLIGWAQVLKGLGRFLAPGFAVTVMARATDDRAWYFRAGGVLALALSAFTFWIRFGLPPAR